MAEKLKKLYRSDKGRMLAGVCGGIAEYLNVDPTVIRVIWVLITFFSFFFGGILAYLVCWFIIPEKE